MPCPTKTKNAVTRLLAEDDVEEVLAAMAGQSARPRRGGGTDRKSARAWAARDERISPSAPAAWHAPQDEQLAIGARLDVSVEESEWVRGQLNGFFEARLITSVLRRIKGGKEANVYVCAAHPSTGLALAAAKIYRPRILRNMRNDAQYRQGRPVLNGQGRVIGTRDWRLHKAIAKKSRTGLEATQTSWVDYEYQSMLRLHQAGVSVPRPLRHSGQSILMQYLGDDVVPAPMLSQTALEPGEAPAMFDRLLADAELMLANHIVHGDLSAYNVLVWDERTWVIDLPQVVDPRQNPDAHGIFQRDITRLCQYFARYGLRSQPAQVAAEMWRRHVQPFPPAEWAG